MADKVNNVTTKFIADVSDFLKDTQSMKRGIAQANAEFKNATAGMDRWQDSTDGLQAKLTQLNKIVQIEKKRLADMTAEYEELEKAGKANTAEAQRLATAILNQSAKIGKAEAEISKYEKTLADIEKTANEAGDAVEKLGDELGGSATPAQKLRKEIERQEDVLDRLKEDYLNVVLTQGKSSKAAQNLKARIDNLNSELKDNKDLLEQVEDAADDAGDGFTVAKGAVAGFIANGLTKLAEAAKNAITSVLGLADATREYRQTLGTLDTAARDVGVNTDFVRDKFTDLMGVFNDEDSITEGLNNLLTAGFDEKSLGDITESLEGAALKWKDTLKFEGMADSLQEWIGTGGESLTGQFAELLERMGYNLEDVEKKTKNMTAEQRRTYVTNLLAAEGLNTVSESYREQNANIVAAQKANVDYQNKVAEVGAKLEPITTKIREGFARILDKVLELLEDVDFEALGASIDAAFDTFINDILPKIVDGLQWIIDNKDFIVGTIVTIGAAFLAWKAVSIITGVVNALKNMTVAFKALNAVMKANVVGIVITAIAALVAAFIYLWKNCDGFRKFWKDLWAGIKSAAKAVADWIGDAFRKAWNAVKNAWSKTKQFFADIWSSIKNTFKNVASWFSDIFKKAWQGIKNAFKGVAGFFGGIWDKIVSTFRTVGTKVADAIGGAFKTAINAVIRTVEGAINLIPKAVNKAIGAINKLPNVNISKIPTVSLPRLAKGGIVDTATVAQIGEAGKEAVIPLERNTQGLKEIAHLVAEEIGVKNGGVTVVNNNTFNGLTTTRYALHLAQRKSEASWKLLTAHQGGV